MGPIGRTPCPHNIASARLLSPGKLVPLLLILAWIGKGVCIKVGSALDAASPITGKKVLAVSSLHRFLQSRGFAGSKPFYVKQPVSLLCCLIFIYVRSFWGSHAFPLNWFMEYNFPPISARFLCYSHLEEFLCTNIKGSTNFVPHA